MNNSVGHHEPTVHYGDQDEPREKMNEKAVLIYVNMEKSKTKFNDTIMDEYNEKVILYGYVIVRSNLKSKIYILKTILN